MKLAVQKLGNSLAVRLPGALVKELGLRPGSLVELSPVEEKLTLESLLEGMSEANLHAEASFGGPIGSAAL